MTDQQKERLQVIHSVEGFIGEWYKLRQIGYTPEHALDLLNQEYKEFFGEERYTDLQSFYTVKKRKEKAQREDSPT